MRRIHISLHLKHKTAKTILWTLNGSWFRRSRRWGWSMLHKWINQFLSALTAQCGTKINRRKLTRQIIIYIELIAGSTNQFNLLPYDYRFGTKQHS